MQARYFAGSKGTKETNRTVYYDTPDHLLWRNGAEFRVRGNKKGHKQAVKARIPGQALFARSEAETAIPTAEPDAEHLRAALPCKLAAGLDTAALQPVFQSDVERRKRVYDHGDASVEIAYDRGELRAGEQTLAICEVELELKKGSAADLANAALAFVEEVPCGLLTSGKAARGYRLAAGFEPQPVNAKPPVVAPDTSLPDAIAAMARDAFAQALANQASLLATSDPEAVHQMRVGLRRLRSIVSAFKPVLDLSDSEALMAETKRFFALLGDMREADVFLAETIGEFPPGTLSAADQALLEREVRRFRQHVQQQVEAYAAGPEFARLALGWLAWIEQRGWLRNEQPLDRLLAARPVSEFAESRLSQMNRKLAKSGRRALRGSIDDWHRARIAAKKLRYAGGPLLAVLDPGSAGERASKHAKQATKRLAKLQNELGRFNDLCNVGPFLERVRATVPARTDKEFAVTAAFCAGWCHAQVQNAIPRLEETWLRFEAASGQQP